MSACINKVALLGNLGKDPEVREISSGKVVSFSLATSDSWTDKAGERQERTEWHRVVAYNGLGEIADPGFRWAGRRVRRRLEDKEQGRDLSTFIDCLPERLACERRRNRSS
jgi:hypothetical protein